jgi:hypothetical protein
MPNKYEDALTALKPIEVVDAHVFREDGWCPQSVCDLVLALALAFNDFKDIVLSQQFIQMILPASAEPSKELGQAGGLSEHLFRLILALIQELVELIARSKSAVEHPVFLKVIRALHPEARAGWKALTALNGGPKSVNSVARLAHSGRNKVASHYDAKAISAGYRAAFVGSGRVPYISRGPSMAATRFYFADAAAQQYLRDRSDPAIVDDFFSAKMAIFNQINHSIREVVSTFVALRAAQLAKPQPPN